MRLARCGAPGAERPALIDAAGNPRDLSAIIEDISGEAISPHGLRRLRAVAAADLPVLPAQQRYGPPVAGIGKIIGVGLNYRDHAAECNLQLPDEPTLFLKATSALCGPTDPLLAPRGFSKLDWEVELGVVIGTAGAYIAERDAPAHVAGYCLGVDFSEREFQFNRGGQGFKGKSADSFAPLGPWLVTADDLTQPQALRLHLSVNGVPRQSGTSAEMIFSIPALIAYISTFMSLQPGDVILTGTPAGVGMGAVPPHYLQPGDRVEAAIDGLGVQLHEVVRC